MNSWCLLAVPQNLLKESDHTRLENVQISISATLLSSFSGPRLCLLFASTFKSLPHTSAFVCLSIVHFLFFIFIRVQNVVELVSRPSWTCVTYTPCTLTQLANFSTRSRKLPGKIAKESVFFLLKCNCFLFFGISNVSYAKVCPPTTTTTGHFIRYPTGLERPNMLHLRQISFQPSME